MKESNEHHQQPWFRNPMVWLIIALPSTAIIASMITIVIAVKTDDGLVVDNYYKKGLQINQDISYDQAAKDLGLSAFVDINTKSGEIQVSISASEQLELPAEVAFDLIHRTRSGQDQRTVLSRAGNSADYRGYLRPPVIEGRWTIQLSATEQWRLRQNLTTRSAQHILMNITP